MNVLKKIFRAIKKCWWVFLLGAGVIIGLLIPRRQKQELSSEVKKRIDSLKSEQKELEEELKRLKEEEKAHEKTQAFDDSESAADYLNKLLRRIQNDNKK